MSDDPQDQFSQAPQEDATPPPPEESGFFRSNPHIDRYNVLGRLQLVIGAGLALILLYAAQFYGTGYLLKIAGMGILAAAGFLLGGFVLGFVFAIPRTAAASSSAGSAVAAVEDGSRSQAYVAGNPQGTGFQEAVVSNGNLVDISDWLTKILVGVGLIELSKIPSKVKAVAAYLAYGLRNCADAPCVQSSEACAMAIVLFFSAAGFMLGYAWTKFYYETALADRLKRAEKRAQDYDQSWIKIEAARRRIEDHELGQATDLINDAQRLHRDNPAAMLYRGMILSRLAQTPGQPLDEELLKKALAWTKRGADHMPTHGAPLYNMACYQALLGDKPGALKNLAKAIQIVPALRVDARKDDDLISLRETPEFKKLVSPEQHPIDESEEKHKEHKHGSEHGHHGHQGH